MAEVPQLVPARMLNEYAYCPRLAYLMWVEREWAENVETLEGKHAHRRVDRAEGERATIHQRSLHLSSERLGLTAVLDLVESRGGRVRPVDYKRGKRPSAPGGVWEPEKVQLCAQGLLLREHGLDCREGIVYFVASRSRVRVRFTAGLVGRTLELLAGMRRQLAAARIPPPLEDSPKCPRCSLVSICLPEETRFLARGGTVRPLAVRAPARFPLVVQQPGAAVRLRKGELYVEARGERIARARLGELSQLVLMSGAQASSALLHECCRREIPVLHMSGTGWFYGVTQGLPHKNVALRATQFAAAADESRALPIARALVAAKVHNARVLLRRHGAPPEGDLARLQRQVGKAERAPHQEALLGVEGTAGKLYFGGFATMLKGGAGVDFDFAKRSRRPPADAVNALLSFAYALLVKDWTVALHAVGFDPLMGFYHQPRYGRPALALDLMEPFRPVLADSAVLRVLNNGEVGPGDFYERLGGVVMKPTARKRLIAAYEQRLAQEIRHPVFGYRASYRRIFELEARLLARYLGGEVPAYDGFRVR